MTQKTIVVLGSTGSGKSALCNVLGGFPFDGGESVGFPVSDSLDGCNTQPRKQTVNWLGDGEEVSLIDTPGFDDSQGRDSEHIANLVEELRSTGLVNAFLLVVNSQKLSIDAGIKAMLLMFTGIFGADFYKNMILAFSRWSFDESAKRRRTKTKATESGVEDNMNSLLRQELGWTGTIPAVFIDSCCNCDDGAEREAFSWQVSRLEMFIRQLPSFDCCRATKVRTELEDLKVKKELVRENRHNFGMKANSAKSAAQKAEEKKDSSELESSNAKFKELEEKERLREREVQFLDKKSELDAEMSRALQELQTQKQKHKQLGNLREQEISKMKQSHQKKLEELEAK